MGLLRLFDEWFTDSQVSFTRISGGFRDVVVLNENKIRADSSPRASEAGLLMAKAFCIPIYCSYFGSRN